MKKALIILSLLAPSLASAQSVDLLWQGVNYVPPFYQGGSLWSEQGSLVFYAVPQGLGNASKLSYKWIKDGTVLGSLSGVGHNALYSNDPIFSKSQTVEVQVVDANDNILARNSLTLKPVPPSLLVYEKSPVYGYMLHREVGSAYRIEGDEVVFAGFPLFFSLFNRNDSALTYSWRSSAGEDGALSSITYRVPDNAQGSASVSATVVNNNTVKQQAGKNFLVQFGHEE